MNKSYNEMVDGLKNSRKSNHEPAPIRKCMYQGCPMNANVFDGGNYRCSYHENGDYHRDVTNSIIKNKELIRAYSKMTHWSTEEWTANILWAKGYSLCQMTDNDAPSTWLVKFHDMVSNKIKDDAVQIIEDRVNPPTRFNDDY